MSPTVGEMRKILTGGNVRLTLCINDLRGIIASQWKSQGRDLLTAPNHIGITEDNRPLDSEDQNLACSF